MKARNIIIGCVVLLLLCSGIAAVAFFAFGRAVVQVAGTVVAAVQPYQIGSRPVPADGNQDTLMPATVGNFVRQTVSGAAPAFVTSYLSGSDTISAEITVFTTATDAENAVKALKDGDTTLTFNLVGLDPSFATDNTTQGQATKMGYSRGPYFFYFVGSSAGALDAFMTKFPF